MLKKGIKNMSKVETISVEKKEVDQQLISLIDKNIVDVTSQLSSVTDTIKQEIIDRQRAINSAVDQLQKSVHDAQAQQL